LVLAQQPGVTSVIVLWSLHIAADSRREHCGVAPGSRGFTQHQQQGFDLFDRASGVCCPSAHAEKPVGHHGIE
jgi:hypothetical protein